MYSRRVHFPPSPPLVSFRELVGNGRFLAKEIRIDGIDSIGIWLFFPLNYEVAMRCGLLGQWVFFARWAEGLVIR